MSVFGSSSLLGRVLRSPAGVIGLFALLSIFFMAATAGLFFPRGPFALVSRPYLWPGTREGLPFGTDPLGRDMLAGIFYGSRISLLVGFVATACALIVGIFVGSVSGYFGGKADAVLMRVTDAIQTIPGFLFAIVLVGILSPSLFNIILAIATVSWPPIARLTRAEVLRVRAMEYVDACRLVGMSHARIIFTQILPNSLSPVIVATAVLVATAIITEAGLSFLGLGDPNVMSWGTLINAGRSSIRTSWYISIIPSLFIVLTVLALNLLGDAVNDALNPYFRKR
ncbi:ABC transporter permease [Ancylobacter pratisalsi]|uniref:ABC transporter permease n=1 Tax=Ancylobacter pratisalsi TaxID=1745854 RepID=A0A6P1YMQ7_9HYPH|nr:ABC transporter permease [Ancylobacter pratisalsi]QIB34599.1 ABC transporter permease [Ancylobacter pratisalsi]